MHFDIDGTAHDVVMTAQSRADKNQKPYAIVHGQSGRLLVAPVDQCAVEALEVVWPNQNKEASQ